jgi:hypothetical protein
MNITTSARRFNDQIVRIRSRIMPHGPPRPVLRPSNETSNFNILNQIEPVKKMAPEGGFQSARSFSSAS